MLASGDPLFYGVARYLCDHLGKDRFEVLPHVSSMQLAFARVKESWEEAFLTNLANHSLEDVIEKIRIADKVGIFTSESCPPSAVARGLLDSRIDYFSAYVCENLGSPDERVTQGELSEIAGEEFSPLNVMILVRKPMAPDRPTEAMGRRLFGNPDQMFLQSRPKHGLAHSGRGAGDRTGANGSRTGERRLGHRRRERFGLDRGGADRRQSGTVYAIEMDADDHQLIRANAERFGVKNLVAVLGRAPDAWSDLPDPDCVFVGGSGREIARLVELAFGRLRAGGRLVASVGSIENLSGVHEMLSHYDGDVGVWMINIARGVHQLERVRFDALSPTFLLAVVKPQ